MAKQTQQAVEKPQQPAEKQSDLTEVGSESAALAVVPAEGFDFTSSRGFEHAQRVAKFLSASTLVPKQYQGNIPNCMIAYEIALRLRMSPLQVMQSLNVINGQPGWSAQFVIATINTCGKYSGAIQYKLTGEGMQRRCVAWARDRVTGEIIEGSPVTMEMAKGEGWFDRNPKWRTMPEHMLRFRAATFFGREQVSERLLGMPSADELLDRVIDVPPESQQGPATGVAGAKELLRRSDTGGSENADPGEAATQ